MSARAVFELPSGQTVVTGQEDFRKPVCSKGHPASRMVREVEGWVCLDCFDEFLVRDNPGGIANRTKGGVIVPKGTKNPDAIGSRELGITNREARRWARRKHERHKATS